MNTFQFTTNINCSGCIAAVTPFLNAVKGVHKWQVDTVNPGKILTVQTDEPTGEEITAAVLKAGYKIAPLQEKV